MSKRYRLEDQIGFLLRRAHQHASSVFGQEMSVLSLTPPQFAALIQIHEAQSLSQNQLGRLTDTDPATVVGIVKRLVERGLINRIEDKHHKRKLKLQLTAAGQSVVEDALPRAQRVTQRTLEALPPQDQQELVRLLSAMVARTDTAK